MIEVLNTLNEQIAVLEIRSRALARENEGIRRLQTIPRVGPLIIGYARTSTTNETAGLAAQERDLTAAGAERIFAEQVSSVASRAKLTECLAFLRDGDVPAVTKPDRLARSTAELLTIEADLSKHGIGLIVLSMGGERLDTRHPTSKLMLTILAGVTAWEGEIMLEGQREGIAKAKTEGKYKGRPTSIDACEVKRVAQLIGPAAASQGRDG